MQISLTLHKNFPEPEVIVSVGIRKHEALVDAYFSVHRGSTLVRDIGVHIPTSKANASSIIEGFYNVTENDIPF